MKIKSVYVFLLSCLFFACSEDKTNDNLEEMGIKDNISSHERISSKDYDHVVYYSNFDAGIKNGVVSLFKSDISHGELTYTGDLGYEIDEYTNKVRVKNENDTDEYFDIYNVTELSDKLVFDVKTDKGTVLEDVEYVFDGSRLGCPWCWVIGAVVTLVKVVVDASTETECQTAIAACVSAGGTPSTTISSGLFTYSCTVTCN